MVMVRCIPTRGSMVSFLVPLAVQQVKLELAKLILFTHLPKSENHKFATFFVVHFVI